MPAEVVGQKAIRSEIDIYARAVSSRGSRSGAALRVRFLDLFGGRNLPPEDFAIAAVERECDKFLSFERRDENAIAPDGR